MSLLSSTDLGVENNNGIPVLTYAAIISNQVPYLEAVVAESLRSAQVTPLTGRDTTEDTIILGHHVPKGQLITFASALSGDLNNRERAKAHPEFFIPPDSDSRSPTSRTPERKMGMWDKYTDRMEFAPERWLDYVKDANEKETRVYNAKKGYNFQFGAGVRGCFGKPVAVRLHLFLGSWIVLIGLLVDPGTQTGSRDD
jgi:cytochrome P450